jgi:antitoxin YefM
MISVTDAQLQLSNLIKGVNQSSQPIVIAGETGNAVLLSESNWSAIQETLYLLSSSGFRESIHDGMNTSIEQVRSGARLVNCQLLHTQQSSIEEPNFP